MVEQDRCSMKVCSDSCLFGAWMADRLSLRNPARILDIGTGTGLLSLIVAQKTNAIIDAFEIDQQSYKQAKENFERSPWSQRLNAHYGDITLQTFPEPFDAIICNPPFYNNHPLPENEGKKNSKHAGLLIQNDLIFLISTLLSDDGICGILLPAFSANEFEQQASENLLFVNEKCDVRQTFNHKFFRAMLVLEKQKRLRKYSEMSIKDGLGNYTPAFVELLRDYYLYL